MTKEQKDYEILSAYIEKGFYCAIDEARRQFGYEHECARLKVMWVLDQAGIKIQPRS